MKNVNFYNENEAPFKININILEVCSSNMKNKRMIKNVEMNIYKNNKKLSTVLFNDGFWMPSQKKFFLKSNTHITKGCFLGTNSLTINLKSNIINSVTGHYFNLKNGENLKINCLELTKI